MPQAEHFLTGFLAALRPLLPIFLSLLAAPDDDATSNLLKWVGSSMSFEINICSVLYIYIAITNVIYIISFYKVL